MMDQINAQIKEAMKNQKRERLEALRFIKAKLLENKTSKAPTDEMGVIIAHCKQLKDSLEAYPKDGEHYRKIEGEISVVMEFMPLPMSESDVKNAIAEIKKSQAQPNLGSIMRELSPRIKGRFDGKEASRLVKEALEP